MIQRVLLALAVVAGAAPAYAQQQPAVFFPRYDFLLAAEHLSSDDPRYVWDADFGGEIDVVDYGAGRVTFTANYEVILGEQLRRFDPNQGNYILAGSASARLAGVELAGVFYHQSRHLSDRPKTLPVDWNMIGGRLAHEGARGRAQWRATADLRRTLARSWVDYRWELDTRVRGQFGLRPHLAAISTVGARVLGVDGSRDRGTQAGYLAEGGVRIEGDAGAMEFFLAAERRIDPYPIQFGTVTWVKAGFRLVGVP